MAEPSHPVERMSDVKALMWNLEKDPHLSAAFANLTVFDRRARRRRVSDAASCGRQRTFLASAGASCRPSVGLLPRLGKTIRISTSTTTSGARSWSGHRRELLDLAATLAADAFDRTRPLWEFHIVEGLADGRSALVQKMHHTITDGEGGVRMSLAFIDVERDAPEPESSMTARVMRRPRPQPTVGPCSTPHTRR